MVFSMCHCVCYSHPTSDPTPCLECVYASVHVCMFTWLPISPQTPMHSYMETWVLLYGTVFVSQSPHFCSHTLFRTCTFISTCTCVHPTPHVSSNTLWIVTWKHGFWYVALCVSQSPCLWSHTLIKVCICISTCIHVHLTCHICFIPLE